MARGMPLNSVLLGVSAPVGLYSGWLGRFRNLISAAYSW
jgi:hypothetical protein